MESYRASIFHHLKLLCGAQYLTPWWYQRNDSNVSYREYLNNTFREPLYPTFFRGMKVTIYPIELRQLVVVVPKASPYDGLVTLLRAFTSDIILFYCFVVILLIIAFLSYFRLKRRKTFSFFENIADVFNLLMNDNDNINYRRLSDVEVMMIVPLTFAGFIIVNGTLSVLQPQVDTLQGAFKLPYFFYTDPGTKLDTTEYFTVKYPELEWNDKVREISNKSDSHFVEEFREAIKYSIVRMEKAKVQVKMHKLFSIPNGVHIISETFAYDIVLYDLNIP